MTRFEEATEEELAELIYLLDTKPYHASTITSMLRWARGEFRPDVTASSLLIAMRVTGKLRS